MYTNNDERQESNCLLTAFDLSDPRQLLAFVNQLYAWKWSAQPFALDGKHIVISVMPGGALKR